MIHESSLDMFCNATTLLCRDTALMVGKRGSPPMKKAGKPASPPMKKLVKKPGKRGRPPKKKPMKKLGKASELAGNLWKLWLAHVLREGRCWLYVCLIVTHLLCLRITECLRLKANDVSFKTNSVVIKSLKRQAAVRKPLLPEIKKVLNFLQEKGIKRRRTTQEGARGTTTWTDHWRWPTHGFLFPSDRVDSETVCRKKDTVCKAAARLRQSFAEPTEKTIRSHSGRHRMVNDLKTSGIPEEVGMLYSRIADRKTYQGYGGVTNDQATSILKKNKALRAMVGQLFPGGNVAKAAKKACR